MLAASSNEPLIETKMIVKLNTSIEGRPLKSAFTEVTPLEIYKDTESINQRAYIDGNFSLSVYL